MSIFEALILGLVQGLTEFIPVSSSGHLLLVHEVLGSQNTSLSFDVALHVGTLVALLVYFWKDIADLLAKFHTDSREGRLARLLAVATIPAAVAGLLFNTFIEDNLRSSTIVAMSLAGVAVLMLLADKYARLVEHHEVKFKQGLFIGFAQALALIPGVSRSGITITAGLFAGLSREKAARFSFLLAIPIITGSAIGIFIKDGFASDSTGSMMVGMFAAFASGLFAIAFLLKVIARVGLTPFAWYRIALAAVVLVFLV